MQPTSIYRVVNPDTITQSVQRLKAMGMMKVAVASALGKGIVTIKGHWNKAGALEVAQ